MSTIVPRIYLAVAGLTAAVLGGLILLAPVGFYSSYGLNVAGQSSLTSELRSHALLLFGAGIFMGSGAFIGRWTFPALATAAAVYLSYGLSRLVGVAMDGLPSASFQVAGATELLLGFTGLALLRLRRPRAARQA